LTGVTPALAPATSSPGDVLEAREPSDGTTLVLDPPVDSPAVAMQLKPAAPACRAAYASAAMVHPATLFCVGAGIGLGLLAGSVLAGLIAVTLMMALAGMASTTATFRRMVDDRARDRARMRRRHLREGRLAVAGVPRDGLLELTAMVDDIEQHDPSLVRRYELDELLDHHVEVALTRERCVRAMRMADRDALAGSLDSAAQTSRRGRFVARRIRYWDRCRAQAERCSEELQSTAELIRLLAQRAACPDLGFDIDALDRRVADLDEEEAALRQLAQ
jgi:hypothetical protein